MDSTSGSVTRRRTSGNAIANTAPVAANDTKANAPSAETDEDTVKDVLGAELVVNDFETDGDTKTVTAVVIGGRTVHGTVSVVGGNVRYNPNGQFENLDQGDVTTDTFTYTVSDGDGGTDTAVVTVTINGINDHRRPGGRGRRRRVRGRPAP